MVSYTVLLLSACDIANSEPNQTVVKPVKLYQVPNIEALGYDSFLAKFDAAERSQLSFQVPGVLKELHALEGTQVKKGQLLAALDPTDYELYFEASKAQYDLAKINYQRDKQLAEKNLISTNSLDTTETAFKAADAALEQARADLGYTKIYAPFDGVISLKFIEKSEFVHAKQAVLNILNNDKIKVTFSLPIPYIKKAGIPELKEMVFSVAIDSYPNLSLTANLTEMSTKPDRSTNSYLATAEIDHTKNINVLSGMSGHVLAPSPDSTNALYLPSDAILSQADGTKMVWRFNPKTQRVESQKVTINEFGAITHGVNSGDLIVTAGAEELAEGQFVRAWTREGGI